MKELPGGRSVKSRLNWMHGRPGASGVWGGGGTEHAGQMRKSFFPQTSLGMCYVPVKPTSFLKHLVRITFGRILGEHGGKHVHVRAHTHTHTHTHTNTGLLDTSLFTPTPVIQLIINKHRRMCHECVRVSMRVFQGGGNAGCFP